MGAHVAGSEKRGRAVAVMMAGLTVANIVGVPLVTWAGQTMGWRLSYIGVGILGFLAVAAIAKWLPRLPVHGTASLSHELSALVGFGLTALVLLGIGLTADRAWAAVIGIFALAGGLALPLGPQYRQRFGGLARRPRASGGWTAFSGEPEAKKGAAGLGRPALVSCAL